jgi:glycosyltransferase involved in cell wall biosynthesis
VIRVAIDSSAVVRSPTGVARYVTELVAGLRRSGGVEPIIGPAYDLWAGVAALQRGARDASLSVFTRGWLNEYGGLGARLRREAVAVYHATASRAPVHALPTPLVVSIHDCAAFECPELVGVRRSARLRAQIENAVRAAQILIVPTESVRAELTRHVPPAAGKTVVIPYGVGTPYRDVARREPHTDPTFMCVATLTRRKNLATVIDAFRMVVDRHRSARLRLFGRPDEATTVLEELITRKRLHGAVAIEGYISDSAIAQAYRAPRRSCTRRSTRGLASPSSRRWHPARR